MSIKTQNVHKNPSLHLSRKPPVSRLHCTAPAFPFSLINPTLRTSFVSQVNQLPHEPVHSGLWRWGPWTPTHNMSHLQVTHHISNTWCKEKRCALAYRSGGCSPWQISLVTLGLCSGSTNVRLMAGKQKREREGLTSSSRAPPTST
jgi:hypothetical protein